MCTHVHSSSSSCGCIIVVFSPQWLSNRWLAENKPPVWPPAGYVQSCTERLVFAWLNQDEPITSTRLPCLGSLCSYYCRDSQKCSTINGSILTVSSKAPVYFVIAVGCTLFMFCELASSSPPPITLRGKPVCTHPYRNPRTD